MTSQQRPSGRSGRRDPYPLRIAGVALGSVLLLVIVLVWALFADDGRVHVSAGSNAAGADLILTPESGEAVAPEVTVGGPGVSVDADAETPVRDSGPATVPTPAAPAAQAAVLTAEVEPPGARTSTTTPDVTSAVPTRSVADPPSDSDVVMNADAGSRMAASDAGERSSEPDIELAAAFHTEGVYRLDRGDVEVALERLARAVEISPWDPVYRDDFGWALFTAGHTVRGADEIEASIRLDPGRPQPFAKLGEVRLELGDTAAALAAYLRFVRLNEDPDLDAEAQQRIREIRGR